MKLTVRRPVEIEAAAIRCNVPVRYDEEDMPNDFPFRKGDMWDVTIDIETGKIRGWPKGVQAELSIKVCDEGNYYLLAADGSVIASVEEDYVVECIPQEYGDYIDFKISANGTIADWKDNSDQESVRAAFDLSGEDD